MKYVNQSDKERDAINQFKSILLISNKEDEIIFNLWDYEIAALLRERVIEPEPPKGWFDRIFWHGKQYRVVKGYPNVIIYKRERIAYGKMV
jgi:hypothetical protein